MPANWEERFSSWAMPPGQTERDKIENAVGMVRKAITGRPAFAGRNVTVFAQGSYRNRTNVRADSDVDLCVLCSDAYFYDVPAGMTLAQFAPVAAAGYTFDQFRTDVGVSLRAHFGAGSVRSGSKAFDIHENTYRIAADVVPCFEYKWFGLTPPAVGTAFLSNGTKIFNYPEQHYSSGVAKNKETGKRFKAIVRILKRLRYEMLSAGKASAQNIASFLLESLVWNVPTPYFAGHSYRDDLIAVVSYLWANTQQDNTCNEWREVNSIKYLFRNTQPWTRDQTNAFLLDAWGYAELS